MRLLHRVQALEERAAPLLRPRPLAVVLPLAPGLEPPAGFERPGPTSAAVVIARERAERRRVARLLRQDACPRVTPELVVLDVRDAAARALVLAATGQASEVAVLGARGDGKSIAALLTMLAHARLHADAGHPLPVRWMAVTDTFASHKLKTIRTLEHPFWGGIWRLRDDGHVAEAVIDGQVWVALDLFGVEDAGAMDRMRMEAHALWLEEPAPAALLDSSSGVSESAFLLGVTSLRLPSHAHPAIITSNYPDDDHWVWRRFVTSPGPGRACVRIPPGERANAEQRAQWAEALKDRPDLLRRLLEGQPGTVQLGAQVAVGYNALLHVAKERLEPVHGIPLVIGWDAGHTPTAIFGQRWPDGTLAILAALVTEGAGTLQHIEDKVLPWLQAHAPWTLRSAEGLYHYHDPSMDTGDQSDVTQSPVRVIRKLLGGVIRPGAVSWPGRRDPMLAVMNRLTPGAGRAALQLDPEHCALLDRALSGRWYYVTHPATGQVSREQPKKPNPPWADLGDAFCYLVAGLAPMREAPPRDGRPRYAEHGASAWGDETRSLSRSSRAMSDLW